MRGRAVLAAAVVAALAAIALAAFAQDKRDRPTRADGLLAFDTIQKVLQHPRCQNCHIPGDAPLQLDSGVVHNQNVLRGPDGKGSPGLPCSSCHAAANPPDSYGAHTPPGAPNWELPPPEHKMVFIGLSKADLCARVKDPKENGGKDLAALLVHASDPLVLWGWSPGVGRNPVPIPHAEYLEATRRWIDAGAPCPAVTRGTATATLK